MSIALYEMTAEFKAVAQKLEELDLDDQTIADTLEGYSADFENKVIAISSFIRNLESTSEAIKQAEADMYARRKSLDSKIEHLKSYVLANMKAIGMDKVECPLFKVSIKTNAPSVQVANEDAVPAKFVVMKTSTSIDKKALKEAIEAGEVVEGVSLVRSNTLSIK